MGEMINQLIDDWSEGVNTSLSADCIPLNSGAHGYNTAFSGSGRGKTIVVKRPGLTTINATPITATPAVIGQYMFRLLSGGSLTTYHMIVDNIGGLHRRSDATIVAADAVTPSPFTTGNLYPSFETANNLCFMVNGTDAKKFNGTTVQTFGIVRPTVGTLAGAAGAAGTPNGTYELRVTYYNTSTGHESSASNTATATVTVTSQKISVTNIPVSGDSQVDARRIYVRNTSTMSVFYLAATISDNTTTTATLDFTDANLVTEAPNTTENGVPPTGAAILSWHQSRMFVSDGTDVYFSSIEKPEAFDPANYLAVNPDDGQAITGLLSAYEILIIFKRNSIYGLFGTDPNSWEVRPLIPDTGCTNFRTICAAEGRVYFHSDAGLARLNGPTELDPIGSTFLAETFNDVNFSQLDISTACVDLANRRILLALPGSGETTNTFIVPFNFRADRFEADLWDPMDAASLAVVNDYSTETPVVFLGSYYGQIFKFSSALNDGATSGTTGSTINTIGGGGTTFTHTAAAFDTTGNGLKGRAVYFINPTTTTIIRRIITSNTATQLTVGTAAPSVTTSWTYQVGAINFRWDTPWLITDPRFYKKRLRFVYATVSGAATVYLDVFTNYSGNIAETLNFTSTSSSGGVWGAMVWGSDVWGDAPPYTETRLRLGRTATAVRYRVRECTNGKALTLAAIGTSAELKSDRVN